MSDVGENSNAVANTAVTDGSESSEHSQNHIQQLKRKRITSLAAVTKKRNKLASLMASESNLHLVKSELHHFSELLSEYKGAYYAYFLELPEEQGTKEANEFAEKNEVVLEFKSSVEKWIKVVEERLGDEIDQISIRSSRRSSSVSSRLVRVKEKAKLAELLVEKSRMKEKQAVEALLLDIEIDKAKAREAVYAAELGSQILDTSTNKKTPADNTDAKQVLSSKVEDEANLNMKRTSNKVMLNPGASDFSPNHQSPLQATYQSNHKQATSRGLTDHTDSTLKKTLEKDLLTLQQNQNEQMLAAHKMLAAAVSLPQPEVNKFKGDSIEYNSFVRAFDARIASLATKPEDKLYYLEQHLEGDARELISGCLFMDPSAGYREARALLESEYGDPYKTSMAYINKILDWPVIKYDDGQGLKRFSIFLVQCYHAMCSLSHMNVLDHAPNLQIMVQKLPMYLQQKWRDVVARLRGQHFRSESAKFADLVNFVSQAAESATDPVFGRDALLKSDYKIKSKTSSDFSKFKGKGRKPEVSSFATKPSVSKSNTDASKESSKTSCLDCKGQHDIDDCQVFGSKSIDEKRTFLRENSLCFACYGQDHVSKGCLKKRTCKICHKKHPTAMHLDEFTFSRITSGGAPKKGASTEKSNTRDETASAACHASSNIMHAVLPVRVQQRGSDTTVETYAFYDNGSSGCFITEELEHDLRAVSEKTTLQLRTMHGSEYVQSRSVEDLVVMDTKGLNLVKLPKTFTREEIPVSHKQIPKPELLQRWSHLHSVSREMPCYRPELNIGLLIGSNCPLALQPLTVIPADCDGPFAVLLRHGWTINGPLHVHVEDNKVTCHRICVQEVDKVKEVLQPSSVLKVLEKDFSEADLGQTPGALGHSKEDRKFIEKASSSCRKNDEGHFEVSLPFRNDNIALPNNKQIAITRAKWQKRKMLQDEKYHADYRAFMDTILSKGYAVKAEEDSEDLKAGKYWFLPHHGVYRSKKPDKIRVVFDCSSKYCGTSLNSNLLQGPDLTNSLIGVLTRFREGQIAFMADIEAMFYQVKVPSEQQDFLRFLWWPEGDLSRPLEEYKMAVHLFGAVSSPSVANFALKRTADEAQEKYGTPTANTIRKNFYVDDCLKSVQTEEEAVKLVDNVREACAVGGFRLTKFTSNSTAVIDSLPKDDLSKEMQTRDLNYDSFPLERALGVLWSVENDSFIFSVYIPIKPPTRRVILSAVSSLYDPLGFVAPFVLIAKKILQDLCRESSLGWDDEIPSEHKSRWESWLSELPSLENISVQRCLYSPEQGSIESREIHVFSDASNIGYGCAAYLRSCDFNGHVNIAFLMGKARLAPLRKISIPRLELTAATVALKIGQMIKLDLDRIPDMIMFHTDATTVLHYLHNERKRFPVFVANRVQLINDYTKPSQWRFIDSHENPADIASRGQTCPTKLASSLWLTGPDFLKKSEEHWPAQPVVFQGEGCEEICNPLDVEETDTVQKLMCYFSDWHKLKRAVAILLRVRKILHDRARRNSSDSYRSQVSIEELSTAEVSIIKWLQTQEFAKEIKILTTQDNDSKIPKNSPLYRLNPFLDDMGLLRVGGKLARADIPLEERHPLIMPKKHPITMQIMRSVHCRLGHAGRSHVLAKLREKFWIVGANSLVRHVLSKCVLCRRFHSKSCNQKMSDLPQDRLKPAPPFTQTGVDLFGPFLVKEGRKELKRYGVLFTCLVCRAVHIETANSLTTDSFLNAMRRFLARRGNIKLIRSDNGTNFTGARKELWKAFCEMDHSKIDHEIVKLDIQWKFNPPGASHMGGVWERQIRTVREVLSRLLKEFASRLDDESLRTLLCEAEAIVNSRPLTTPTDDPDDLVPLSPSSLLTMKKSPICPPPGCFQREDMYGRKRWRQVQYLSDLFWHRWRREYMHLLQARQKWIWPKRNLKIGDLVLIRDDVSRAQWPMAVVSNVEPDDKGFVRSVTVHTQKADYRRPVTKLTLLLPVEEQT